MTLILEPPVRWWRCPDCDTVSQTQRADVHSQMHTCLKNGMTVPLVEVAHAYAKPDAQNVFIERGDYIGNEVGASPIMAVQTQHGDGSCDTAVYAPVATTGVA